MSALKLAVLRQIAYSHSVRGFIRDILKALIPGKWIDRVIASSDAAFDAKLDAARPREKTAAHAKPENGIISAVKKNTSAAVSIAPAIACGMAAPLRSDASPETF